jgi:hypothetical protein
MLLHVYRPPSPARRDANGRGDDTYATVAIGGKMGEAAKLVVGRLLRYNTMVAW